MKYSFLILILIFFSNNLMLAQNYNTKDLWSGEYEIYAEKDDIAKDKLLISKAKDLKSDDVPSKYESDLKRWNITSESNAKKDSLLVRRFLFNSEDDEYEEFGWTELHKAGKMNCIDGGHFFICKTEANTTIDLKGDKPFFTKTGIFGIWLHYGLVNIQKIN